MLTRISGETVIVHPLIDGAEDAHGNPTTEWGPDIRRDHCAIEPRVHEVETELGRSAVVYGFTVYDTFDSPVTDRDEMTVRGVRYMVDGEIARWVNPYTGKPKGAVITVKRVDG